MDTLDLYLILKLDAFRTLLEGLQVGFITIGLIGLGVGWIWYFLEDKTAKIPAIIFTVVFLIGVVISYVRIMIPTTKEMAVLYCAPKIVNSDFVQEDLQKETKEIYDLAKQYLKEKISKEKAK